MAAFKHGKRDGDRAGTSSRHTAAVASGPQVGVGQRVSASRPTQATDHHRQRWNDDLKIVGAGAADSLTSTNNGAGSPSDREVRVRRDPYRHAGRINTPSERCPGNKTATLGISAAAIDRPGFYCRVYAAAVPSQHAHSQNNVPGARPPAPIASPTKSI